jgi:hypothetical protein
MDELFKREYINFSKNPVHHAVTSSLSVVKLTQKNNTVPSYCVHFDSSECLLAKQWVKLGQ